MMERETTPEINWSKYTSRDYELAQELLNEFVTDYLRIIRWIPITFDAYVDEIWDTDSELDDLVDSDILYQDETERDDSDAERQEFVCEHCNANFDFANEFMQHAIDYILENNDIEEISRPKMDASDMLQLLKDHVWNEDQGMSLEHYFGTFIFQVGEHGNEFIDYMYRRQAIPTDIYNKYLEKIDR